MNDRQAAQALCERYNSGNEEQVFWRPMTSKPHEGCAALLANEREDPELKNPRVAFFRRGRWETLQREACPPWATCWGRFLSDVMQDDPTILDAGGTSK